MTPNEAEPGSGPDREQLPDADDRKVRRLLGAASQPPPVIPGEVARRLEGVLADLVAERAAHMTSRAAETGPSAPRPPRPRRSRRWPALLAAAAAVLVLGIGVGNVLDRTGGPPQQVAGAGGSTAEGTVPSPTRRTAQDTPTGPALPGEAGPGSAPRLRTRTLTSQVRRLVRLSPAGALARRAEVVTRCQLPPAGPGDRLGLARLDGRLAVLVVRPEVAGSRLAQVYSCDSARRLASATVGAP